MTTSPSEPTDIPPSGGDPDVIDIDYGTAAPVAVEEAPPAASDPESTIGTGTSMALGCIAGTILLIGFGLLFLGLSSLR